MKYTDEELDVLCSKMVLHCPKCGYVLIKKGIGHEGTIWGKCTSSKCRKFSHFIFTKGRFRLLTAKLLEIIDEKELFPYTKDNIKRLIFE